MQAHQHSCTNVNEISLLTKYRKPGESPFTPYPPLCLSFLYAISYARGNEIIVYRHCFFFLSRFVNGSVNLLYRKEMLNTQGKFLASRYFAHLRWHTFFPFRGENVNRSHAVSSACWCQTACAIFGLAFSDENYHPIRLRWLLTQPILRTFSTCVCVCGNVCVHASFSFSTPFFSLCLQSLRCKLSGTPPTYFLIRGVVADRTSGGG